MTSSERGYSDGRGRWPPWLPWTVLIALPVAVLAVWLSRDAIVSKICASAVDEACATEEPVVEASGPEKGAAHAISETADDGEASRLWEEALGRPPLWPEDFDDPRDCEAVSADLEAVCDAVDRELKRSGAKPDRGTCELLREAGDELAARPPLASGEIRDLESLLGNVVHAVRVLGAEKTVRLAGVARAGDDLAEPLAMFLYRHAVSRDRCAPGGAVDFDRATHDYAVFLLNTVGGQSYLSRRSVRMSALARFYALSAIGRTTESGLDPHGFDPRPHIARSREQLAGLPLLFKDRYLEALDGLERQWRAR